MKPNIFFLLIDSLRQDKCYGKTKTAKTPNLDELIKNGTIFEQAISTIYVKYFYWITSIRMY